MNSRTYAVVGALGAGKTLLLEALAHKAGATTRLGDLADGTSHFATHAEEKERQMSLFLTVACFDHGGVRHQALDTPGFPDLVGDRVSALAAADGALVVLDGTKGGDAEARRALTLARSMGVPAMVVVSRLDNPQAKAGSWEGLGSDLPLFPIQEPGDPGGSFGDPASLLEGDLPEDLFEAIVEQDEGLMEMYLSDEEIPPESIPAAFAAGVLAGEIVPVVFVSAKEEAGIEPLLAAIEAHFPPPEASPFAERAGLLGGDKVALQVFKTRYEGQMGEVQYGRVACGTLKKGDTLTNPRVKETERLTQMFRVFGSDRLPLDSAAPGEVVALVKLKHTLTGDGLLAGSGKFPPIPFPTPVAREGVRAADERQEEKVMEALGTLLREDPAVSFGYEPDTKQNVMTCFGEVQLAVLLARLEGEFGLTAEVHPPRIPYQETIVAPVSTMYRHKKQTGGRGQFAECHIKVSPRPRGQGFEFQNKIVGGKIPEKFVSSVEKGVREAMEEGTMVGAPVVDVEVEVNDGKTHDVDSSDIAFQIAGRSAFREAEKKGSKVLLEPVHHVEIVVPEGLTGEIIGDLNSRRGRIGSVDPAAEPGYSTIKADIPLKEMYKYDNALRSIAKGDGSYSMSFSGYEAVPRDLTAKLVAAHEAEQGES